MAAKADRDNVLERLNLKRPFRPGQSLPENPFRKNIAMKIDFSRFIVMTELGIMNEEMTVKVGRQPSDETCGPFGRREVIR